MQQARKDSRSSTMSSICITGRLPMKITTWWRKMNRSNLSNKINIARDITSSCLMGKTAQTSSPSKANNSRITPSIASPHPPSPRSNPPSSAKAPPSDNRPEVSTSSARAASPNTTIKMRPRSSPKSSCMMVRVASWNSSWVRLRVPRLTKRIGVRVRRRSWFIRSLIGLLGCRKAR